MNHALPQRSSTRPLFLRAMLDCAPNQTQEDAQLKEREREEKKNRDIYCFVVLLQHLFPLHFFLLLRVGMPCRYRSVLSECCTAGRTPEKKKKKDGALGKNLVVVSNHRVRHSIIIGIQN